MTVEEVAKMEPVQIMQRMSSSQRCLLIRRGRLTEGFTSPLLSEANKRRNAKQFTKGNPRCQRGGDRGVENQMSLQRRSRWPCVKPMLCEPLR